MISQNAVICNTLSVRSAAKQLLFRETSNKKLIKIREKIAKNTESS